MSNAINEQIETDNSVNRRTILKLLSTAGIISASSSSVLASSDSSSLKKDTFDPIETTVSEIRSQYISGEYTVRDIIEAYLVRIWEYDDELNSILTVNPNVLEQADELDEQLESNRPMGPLHGVPILLKDNNDTHDMRTTAGSVALEDFVPNEDATLVAKLREAGGIILGKTNLHEFAFGYTTVSSIGGTTRNPYNTEHYAGGSSGGTAAAIAANLGAIGTGTDTGGSVRVPAAATALVGLRPSTGLISRSGIVPLTWTEDTAGPITRTVADAAIMTDVMVGYDPNDPMTADAYRRTPHSEEKTYTDYLNENGLDGARIGVYREYVGTGSPRDLSPDDDAEEEIAEDAREIEALFNQALTDMESVGATIIDVEAPPDDLVELANVDTRLEFNRDLNEYLEAIDDEDAPDSLEEIVESEEYSPNICETIRDRDLEDEGNLDEDVEYLYGLSRRDDLQQVVLSTMVEENLDVIVYPTLSQSPPHIEEGGPWGANAQLSPALDFPTMTVPAGFTNDGLPASIQFLGREFDEETLFELSYSYEQNSRQRRPPKEFGPIENGVSDDRWDPESIEDRNEAQRLKETVAETGECH